MRNNRGFTLVEIISIIALLGLIIGICVPSIMVASTNTKKKTLQTKVDNIEKAAVLYGQDNREEFTENCQINETEYYECMGKIKVKDLISEIIQKQDDGSWKVVRDQYINYDEENPEVEETELGNDTKLRTKGKIKNPIDESKNLNECEIQIYKKYGKIYAVYLAKDTEDETCWYK